MTKQGSVIFEENSVTETQEVPILGFQAGKKQIQLTLLPNAASLGNRFKK